MQATAVSETSAEAIKSPSASARVTSLDIVRGVAMILMAIDHVRVYSGVPAGGPTFGVFFTRWITNFVAPAFVFLAGTSAWLYGRKLSDRWSLSRFLISRGLWLIFLELTFLRVAWTFNFDFQHYLLAGVIWMIGWCMIALAGAVYLPRPAIASIGISLIALHNLSNLFRPQLAHAFGPDGPNWFLRILYLGGAVDIGKSGPPLLVLFVLVPWVGLMFAGYAFGPVIKQPAESRRRAGGRHVFPPRASLLAPAWVAERAVCSWLALGARIVLHGIPYRGTVLRHAATPMRVLRARHAAARELAPSDRRPGIRRHQSA